MGGTKNPDVDEIMRLRPDLVVMNDEENRVEDAAAIESAGLIVHSMSPRSVDDVGPAVRSLADAVGVRVPPPFGLDEWEVWLQQQRSRRRASDGRRRAVVMVWRRPWMTMNADTYGSSLLAVLGVDNAFAEAPERYPEVTLEEVAARRPEVVFLPSEPYPFGQRHLPAVEAAVGIAAVRLIDGRDLFWWGIRTPGAVEALARACA